jgi:uracil-DNA glycosylase
MRIKVVLAGEAWGEREDMFHHAFVGRSGQELGALLAESHLAPPIGITYPNELNMIKYWESLRKDHGIALANVFAMRPENNNIEELFTNAKDGVTTIPPLRLGGKNLYLRPEHMHHVATLWDTLNHLRPNLIIAFGNVSSWAILGKSGITKIRGSITTSDRLNGLKVLPTFHPAAVLRNYPLRPIVLADLTKAARESAYPEVRRPERWILVDPTFNEIEEWMAKPASYYAIDIESGRALYTKAEVKRLQKEAPKLIGMLNEQISMIGFARNRHEAMVIQFMTRKTKDMSYWLTLADEIKAWRHVQRILRSDVPKIFQNGMYDISRLLAYGLRPRNCHHDTMLRHHSIFPELLKGLGFLGSIYSDDISWKEMYAGGETLKKDD